MSAEFVPITLPSKCLPYADVDSSTIKVRPFRGKDEELITELGMGNPSKKLLEILNRVVQGVDPSILTTGDIGYILIWEAINSYSSVYPVRFMCEVCEKSIEINVDLLQLESIDLPDGFTQPQEVRIGGVPFNLRLLTLADDIAVLDFAGKNQSPYLYSYARSIVDEQTNVLGRVEILKEMSTKDFQKIKDFHSKYRHGPDMTTAYTCPKCGSEGKTLVPFRLDELI